MGGLLEYIALNTFKDYNPVNPYAQWSTIKPYSFAKTETEWLKKMRKLEKMGLVFKKGEKYIQRTKLKDWHEYEKDEFILSLHGSMSIDRFDLYELHKNKYEDFRDYIYIGLINSIVNGKNYSRGWIKKVTGYSPYMQKTIEAKHLDKITVSKKLSAITSYSNQEELKNKIVFPAYVDLKNKTISKSVGKSGNCSAIQQGNNYSIKDNYIFSVVRNNNRKEKSAFYKMLNEDVEIKSNEEYDAVFSEEKHKNVRNELFFSNLVYNKFATEKLMRTLNFSNTAFVTDDGSLKSLSNVLKSI